MRHMFLMAVVFVTLTATADAQSNSSVTGGNGTLYVGIISNRILVIDEATMEVTEEIPVTIGIPRSLTLSQDRKRLYMGEASFENIEIIDVETRETIDTFTLSEGNRKVRISGYQVDPLHRFMILIARATTKHVDRFEIGPLELLQYDLTEHRVVRTIPWPAGSVQELGATKLLFSPDGDLLYFFSNDVLIFETENFTQVDKWELSRPHEEGFGSLGSFGFASDMFNEEPGFFTGLFQARDPIQNSQMMGVARINLPEKSVDFYTIGPSPEASVSFTLAPGRQRAYGFLKAASQNIAPVSRTDLIGRFELWTFDLENRRLHERVEIQGRPRMSLKTSTNGKFLYIYQAGNTIDLYDISTHSHLRRIELDGDMTTNLILAPP